MKSVLISTRPGKSGMSTTAHCWLRARRTNSGLAAGCGPDEADHDDDARRGCSNLSDVGNGLVVVADEGVPNMSDAAFGIDADRRGGGIGGKACDRVSRSSCEVRKAERRGKKTEGQEVVKTK
jgi:hypothetical protein